MKIKNHFASNRTTHPCIPSQKPPPLDHSSTFRFIAFAALYFHALRWPSSHASIPYCSAYTCLNSAVRMSKKNSLPACTWKCRRNKLPVLSLVKGTCRPQPGTTAPDPRSFLPPTMSICPCCHVKKMFPHRSIICHLQASNPRPQLTRCVARHGAHLRNSIESRSGTGFIRLVGVRAPCVLEISLSAALAGPLFN